MAGSKLSQDSARASAEHDHVLGLTVYGLPEPGQVMAGEERRTRAGRFKMLLVFLVCAAPVLASYFTYYVIRPDGRRNFGELIDPQRPLPELIVQDLEGKPHPLRELKGQWLLVVASGARCDDACRQQLYLQRQLRESLGREHDRMDRVWLVTDEQPIPAELHSVLQGLTVLRMPAAQLTQWLQPAAGHTLSEHLYVVDPMGNWMMRFPAQLDVDGAAKAKRDLERLLRASASWDQPGRDTP
jgi:hypothetical protein